MGWYRFGEFELDLDSFVLKRCDQVQPLQPKIFDLLRYLIAHRGTVVTKADLLREIWHDEYVNENAIAWSVSHIRRALGQHGGRHPIETIPTRGYRFTAAVAEGGSSVRTPEHSVASAGLEAAFTSAVPALSILVGRAQVMSELEQLARDAAQGRGALCVITGAAGIGKTRCAEGLASFARASGRGTGSAPALRGGANSSSAPALRGGADSSSAPALRGGAAMLQVLWGRCPQDPALPRLWPIAAAFRGLAREQPELAAKVSGVIAGADSDAVSAAGPHAGARFWRIEQVAQLLREAAAVRPTLLILDDLHWADAGTLDLLGFIAPELHELPLCIVATLRDGELQPGSALDQPLRRMLRHARTLPLVAFDATEVADLTQNICSQRPSEALAEALRRAADGVPLFVQEIVRTLLREHGAQGLERLAPEMIRPPAMARDLLRERVQRLPAATVELLSSAAVIGDTFDLSLLLALVELEPEALLERLEPALAEGQLQSDAPHTYRFVHSLFQSVLYDDLPVAKRIAAHRKLGTLLRARPSDERRDADVARHFYLSLPAGDPLLVMQLARTAADAAQRVFAHETAVMHYGWALEAQTFAGTPDARERAELLLALASAQRIAGRTHDALETTSRLLELGQRQRMSDVVVRATRLRRPTVAMSMIPDALARSALEAVLEQEPESPSATRVSALAQLACIPPNTYDLSRSKLLSARAVQLARALSQPEPMLEALRAQLYSLSGPDDVAEVLQVAATMLSLDVSGPLAWQMGDARTARYVGYLLSGRIAEADAVLREMTAAIGDRHWPEATFYWQRLEVQRRFLDGHFDEADQRWKTLHARAARAGVSYADLFYNSHAYNLALEREGAKAVLSRSFMPFAQLSVQTPYTRAGMARIAAEAGEHESARGQLSALGDPQVFPRDAHYLHLLANLAMCASCIDDKPRCEQLFALLSPYADFNTPSQMGYYLGSVSHFLGLLALALGRDVRAGACFERALELNQAMGYRAGVVRTLLAHGRLEMRLGHARTGNDLLARAQDQARELGMKAALAECAAALRAQ